MKSKSKSIKNETFDKLTKQFIGWMLRLWNTDHNFQIDAQIGFPENNIF